MDVSLKLFQERTFHAILSGYYPYNFDEIIRKIFVAPRVYQNMIENGAGYHHPSMQVIA